MRSWLQNNRGFLIFLLCFGFVRTAVADWNPVPSGSMRPTILEGDVVFVNRLAYDFKLPLTEVTLARLAEPQRGDVVTFFSPQDGARLIKRVVGLPGDVVEVRDGVVVINGSPARYTSPALVREPIAAGSEVPAVRAVEEIDGQTHRVQYLQAGAPWRSFGPLKVPADNYFMLGDNRDDSLDSRFIGAVPRSKLIGRAERTLVSADITGSGMPRLNRTWARLE
jgi:signal peptidase I